MVTGVVRAEAVAVRVLMAMGERDVCHAPHEEPSAFTASGDVSLFIAPNMAHMHNFAGTREVFWRRIEAWAHQVAQAPKA